VDGGGSWRAFLEYAGTACGDIGFAGDETNFGCAYENGIFTDGYRRLGRVIGHSAERDARVYTLGGLYAAANGGTWEARVRKAELNRGATAVASPSNTVSPVAADLWNVEVSYTGRWQGLTFQAGVGGDRLDRVDRDEAGTSGRAFVQVTKPW
jgi:hypothetical protein